VLAIFNLLNAPLVQSKPSSDIVASVLPRDHRQNNWHICIFNGYAAPWSL
jgi:hypothetical protein